MPANGDRCVILHIPPRGTLEELQHFRFSVPAPERGPAPVPRRPNDKGLVHVWWRAIERSEPREVERVPARGRGRRRSLSADRPCSSFLVKPGMTDLRTDDFSSSPLAFRRLGDRAEVGPYRIVHDFSYAQLLGVPLEGCLLVGHLDWNNGQSDSRTVGQSDSRTVGQSDRHGYNRSRAGVRSMHRTAAGVVLPGEHALQESQAGKEHQQR